MEKILSVLDFIVYWSIVLMPFSMAISSAAVNIFMGLALACFLAKKIIKNEKFPAKNPLNWPFLFFIIITCVSAYNSINYFDTFIGGIVRLFLYAMLVYVIMEEVKDKKHLQIITASMALGLILTSADELWQVFTGYDFIRGYAATINIGLVRATASFKDANTLGIYLSALAPVILGLTLYYFRGIQKAAFICLSLLALAAVVLTYSRPALLAVYVALFFLGKVRKSKLLIRPLIILALISPFIAPKPVKDWAKEVEYNPIRFMCNDDRIAVYLNTFNMIKAHPVIGLGANTFMKNYKFYKNNPEYRNIVTQDYMYAHNMYLHMAAEIGLLGLGIFFWLIFVLFSECAVIYKKAQDYFVKIFVLSLSAAIIAFLLNGLTESSLYSSRVALIFWFLTGLILSLKKFISSPETRINPQVRREKEIKKMLVVRNDRFGEFLLNIPAFRALKEAYPKAHIIALVNSNVRELAECIGYIDEIIDPPIASLSLLKKFSFVNSLKEMNMDAAIMLNPSRDLNVMTFLAGIPIRIGYDKKGGFLLTHKIEDKKYLGEKHEIEYNLELVGLIGAKTENKAAILEIDPAALAGLTEEFNIPENRPIIAVHPWTSDSVKRWPAWNFVELTKKIVSELNVAVILVGGKEELERSRIIFKGLDSKIMNLTGMTTLKQLAAILKKCRLLISADSGPVHLAQAVQTPVIALFKSSIPGKSAKRWGPWVEGSIVIEHPRITIEQVFIKTKEALKI